MPAASFMKVLNERIRIMYSIGGNSLRAICYRSSGVGVDEGHIVCAQCVELLTSRETVRCGEDWHGDRETRNGTDYVEMVYVR